MALNQSLRQKQQLTLSLAMRQGLKMLQLDGLSLHDFLTEQSLSNPLFSVADLPETSFSNLANVPGNNQPSLYDYLLEQVAMRYRDVPLRNILIQLIHLLDKRGYLHVTETDFTTENHIDKTQFQDAVTLLQSLDPPGVGGRDLQEVLLLQIANNQGQSSLPYRVIKQYFDDFLHNRSAIITQKMNISSDDYRWIKQYIGTLTTNPANEFEQPPTHFKVPDVVVKVTDDHYRIYMTRFGKPVLIFDEDNLLSLHQSMDADLDQYLQTKKDEYQAIADGLAQREKTILAISEQLIRTQWDYIAGDKEYIMPLLLRDVAHRTGLSESTVSRAISGKYIDTPRGVLAMTDLMSMRDTAGDKQNTDTIELHLLAKYVEMEDKRMPLSDQRLADAIKKETGKPIARRTITKYRSILNIPNKQQRRRV
jgi:RNA polymerase sigma-54 factor